MIRLRKANGAKIVRLSLLLALFFPSAVLAACSQLPPPFVSLNLSIPTAALQSPLMGTLPHLRQLTQVGHMCSAFADETYGDLSVSFPASDPWAVAVGGTTLSLDVQGMRSDEVRWSHFPNIFHCNNSWGSGGGNSTLFSRPNWQNARGVSNDHSQNDRQVPDVAAVADNLAVYYDGGWGAVGGTSAAAPIWAAGQALVNEDTIQQNGTFAYGPRLYYKVACANGGSTAYYDVTYGNNLYYTAMVGWDYTTGLGTPDLANFNKAVNNMLATANAS